jgi:uncharacterized protein (TIGR02300 family)
MRDHPISTTSQEMKAMRGTKRVCQACATRFYDLAQDPIVCPSCGAHHVPEAPALAATRAAGFTDKTSWRGRRFKPADPLSEADAAPEAEPEVAPSLSTDQEAPAPNDDVVLDEDEADISDLLGHHEPDSKER